MRLSVNILTWNTIDTLTKTLAILKDELRFTSHEIIIVDNGSDDGCEELATIKNGENLGISKGKNLGIEASRGDFLLLLDGDVVPVPNSVLMLLDHIDTYSDVSAIGFRGNKWTTDPDRAEKQCHTLYEPKLEDSHCLYYGMFRREVFDKCRLDENYGPGYGWEDLDFWRQMKSHGIGQWFCGMNTSSGRYYHRINSSIRNMGRSEYIRTSKERHRYYTEKWS